MKPGVFNLSIALFCFCGLIIVHSQIFQLLDALMATLNFAIGLDSWKEK